MKNERHTKKKQNYRRKHINEIEKVFLLEIDSKRARIRSLKRKHTHTRTSFEMIENYIFRKQNGIEKETAREESTKRKHKKNVIDESAQVTAWCGGFCIDQPGVHASKSNLSKKMRCGLESKKKLLSAYYSK